MKDVEQLIKIIRNSNGFRINDEFYNATLPSQEEISIHGYDNFQITFTNAVKNEIQYIVNFDMLEKGRITNTDGIEINYSGEKILIRPLLTFDQIAKMSSIKKQN